MQTLADQVKEFMKWKSVQNGRAFTPIAMAKAVASHQKELPASSRCSRQNIEGLLNKNIKTTRYIVALAKAMGTTAEVLEEGSYKPPNEDKPQNNEQIGTANPELSLVVTLARLGELLTPADASTRETAAALLASLARNPANHTKVAAALAAMLGNGSGLQFETNHHAGPPPTTPKTHA